MPNMPVEEFRRMMEKKNTGRYQVSPELLRTWKGKFQDEYQKIVFDSTDEMRTFCGAILRERTGEIFDLEIQKKFVLQEKTKKTRAITYYADLYYRDLIDKCWAVDETKGAHTADYMIKRKMFIMKFPDIRFREIKDGEIIFDSWR